MRRVTIRVDVLVLIIVGMMLYVSIRDGGAVSDVAPTPAPLERPVILDRRRGHDDTANHLEINPALPNQIERVSLGAVDTIGLLKDIRSISPEDRSETQGSADDAANAEVVRRIDDQISEAIRGLHEGTPRDWKYTHDKYIALRRYFVSKALSTRLEMLQDPNSTHCMEFARVDEKPSDALYRVPCIPWNTKTLVSVEWKQFGLYSTFEHVRPRELPGLKIAVEMSGHMRTYRKCAASTLHNLLEANNALLFAVTYPDVGDKRFGVREQERDLPVHMEELVDLYGPYLAAVYILDVPTITNHLNALFPAWFHLKQWSWMIYQLFTMDVAHDIATAHLLNTPETNGFHKDDPSILKKVFRHSVNRPLWTRYDVMIRVRPDLYILGPIVINLLDATHFVFNMSCGGNQYLVPFNRTEVIRAPHHPNYQWYLDKLSDHSAIGAAETMGPFMKLFSSVRAMSFSRQNNEVFKHGNTAERMWSQHADRIGVRLLAGYGWHIMLRNPGKFTNSSHVIAKSIRRERFTKLVFGVTDPSEVTCPDPSGVQVTLPPKPKLKKKIGKRPPA